MRVDAPRSRLREIAASSAKVGISTLASLIGWVVGGKILAVELGAAGVGVFGLLRQLLQNLNAFSTFSGSTALVQGLASRSGEDQERYARSVAHIYASGAGLVALVLLAFAPWLGPRLIPHPQATALLRWLAAAVIALNVQSYFMGVLSAHRAVDGLVRSQVLGPVAVLALAWPVARLVRDGHPAGLVLMLMIPSAAVALAAMRRAWSAGWFRPVARNPIHRADAVSFFRTSGVLVTSGLLVTGTQFVLNRLIAARLGLEQSGQFWVAWTLSMTYVTLILGSYSTYYMPALSMLKDRPSQHALIRDYLRLALIAMPVLVCVVIVGKPWAVRLMFSADLLPSLKVMRWMLIGDLFKGVAWVLAFPMLAFNEMRWFFWTELAFNSLMAGGAWWLLAVGGGIEKIGMLFMAAYAVYLLGMCGYIRWVHAFRISRRELALFAGAFALVLGVSLLTWRDKGVEARAAATAVVGVLAFVAAAMRVARGRKRPMPEVA